MRHCNSCDTDKALEEFPLHRRGKDGRGNYCRPCHAARQRARNARPEAKDIRRAKRDGDPAFAERDRERSRTYGRANSEQAVQRVAAWRDANRARRRLQARSDAQRRRALVFNAPVNDFTTAQWLEVLADFGSSCAYCLASGVPLHQEHMQPVSRGGSHTRSNIVPACAPCNLRKGTRSLLDSLSVLSVRSF